MSEVRERDAAQSPDPQLLVIAPPGCGKTELLAHRARHLVPQLQPHQRILALTFSNRATRNLRQRLLQTLGQQRFRRYVRVTNFHGHAAEIIRAHGRTIGLDPASPMPGRSTLADAIAAYTEGLPIGEAISRGAAISAALSEAKRGPFTDDQVETALARSGNTFAQQIEAARRQMGLLHYDDLLRHAQRLLHIDAVARLYQLHYGAVLVDEFQDLSPQQLEIALATCTSQRTFVGDPLQGIYSWAGARPAQVEQRLLTLCGEPQRLTVSYRSSPAVLGVVNQVAAQLDSPPLTAAEPAAWHQGGAAAAAVFDTAVAEAEWIVQMSTKILTAHPAATIGVVTRSAWRRQEIDAAFAAASHLARQRWDLAIEDSEMIQRLVATLDRLPRQTTIEEVRRAVLEEIDQGDVETLEQAHKALAEFESLIEQAGTPVDAVAQLRAVDSDDAIEPGVHLLNAHTGKGQQFDWIFAPGMEEFHIPDNRATTPEQLTEELRVVLVILSRARAGVVVTRAVSRISQRTGKPYSTQASRWWPYVAGACPLDDEGLGEYVESMMPSDNSVESPTASDMQ